MADTDFTADETASIANVQLYNNRAYNATTNPKGFDNDGHEFNFFPALNDVRILAQGARRFALSTAADVLLTHEDARNTGLDRKATADSVLKAASWADNPYNLAVESGKYSARHWSVMASMWSDTPADTIVANGRYSALHYNLKAGGSADRAKTEADRAQSYADGFRIPGVSAADALKFLRVKADGTAYETAVVDLYSASLLVRSARTANQKIVKSDKGFLIDFTANTFAQLFDSAANLGNGWFCYLMNSGNGDITLDPDGSELIDGLTFYYMYPGEVRLIQCDGLTLRSIVLKSFAKKFTSSQSFLKPPGYNEFNFKGWAGGGGGAKGRQADGSATGGGGGAAIEFEMPSSDVPSSMNIFIGAGGTGGAGSLTSGSSGGSTTIGNIISIGAGAGGLTDTAGNTSGKIPGGAGGGLYGPGGGGYGGSPSIFNNGGDFDTNSYGGASAGGGNQNFSETQTIWGGGASRSVSAQDGSAGRGATDSFFGGAGGGTVGHANAGSVAAGRSRVGGNGGAASTNARGEDGYIPGGGGGATINGSQGGNGARGEVRIRGVI